MNPTPRVGDIWVFTDNPDSPQESDVNLVIYVHDYDSSVSWLCDVYDGIEVYDELPFSRICERSCHTVVIREGEVIHHSLPLADSAGTFKML